MLSIIVAGAMITSIDTSWAATTKPTPKPTAKTTKKATPKPTLKTTKKPVTKKPTPKRTVAKKPTPKKKYVVYKKKSVKVAPSPSPSWPPHNFQRGTPPNDEIYYKIPLGEELKSLASADSSLAAQLNKCVPGKYACGVIRVASVNGCTWWEFNSTVTGPLSATDNSPAAYGTLRTTAKGTNKKQIITVLLISTEPLKPNVSVGKINISCHHDPVKETIPLNVYTVNTPSPTDTPTTNTN